MKYIITTEMNNRETVTFPDGSEELADIIDLKIEKDGKVIYENASAKGYVFYENIIDEKEAEEIRNLLR